MDDQILLKLKIRSVQEIIVAFITYEKGENILYLKDNLDGYGWEKNSNVLQHKLWSFSKRELHAFTKQFFNVNAGHTNDSY